MKKFGNYVATSFLFLCVASNLFPTTTEKIIPDEIKSVFKEGIKSRLPRNDIPFSIIKNIYLPAKDKVHSVFIFKFNKTEAESISVKLKSRITYLFLQFYALIDNNPSEISKEVYIPLNLSFNEIKNEDFFSASYPLSPGDYLLAMGISTKNFENIGTQYYEFSLPDLNSENSEITPIFFADRIEQMASPETVANVHKNSFTYSILKISPKIKNIFSSVDTMDVFFFISGMQALSIDYSIKRGGKTVVDYQQQNYSSPLISQPLPLLGRHNLTAGTYQFEALINDNQSGKFLTKMVPIYIK